MLQRIVQGFQHVGNNGKARRLGTARTVRHAPCIQFSHTAKGRFSCAAIVDTQYEIKKPPAEVREEKKRGVEFPTHQKLNAAMERNPMMIRQNHMNGCLHC
jgi:hypothetical protein